ncbi:MAG TPA: phospholipase A [Opitutus sp.]|nr:phospholipase A [Opitutus sp.]
MHTFWRAAVGLIFFNGLWAAPEALLVPPENAVQAGTVMRLTLFLNNPSTEVSEFVLPAHMQAELVSAHEQRTLAVVPEGTSAGTPLSLEPMSFTRVIVAIALPDTLEGNVSMRISDPESNAVMFGVLPAKVVKLSPDAVKAAEAATLEKPEDLDLTSEHEKLRTHISAYEPIYFAVGAHQKTTAKFQFSFKYRFFGPSGNIPEWWREVYFGYTQTSLWDLDDPSLPFYDTSYKPAIFYLRESIAMKPDWLTRLGLQAGVQHESNGSAGDVSRSLNTVFVTPMFKRSLNRKWTVTVAPRVLTYLEKSENPTIPRYRGYVDLMVRVGVNQGVELSAYLRKGSGSWRGSMQYDLSLPLRKIPGVPSTVGGNLLLQYFNGWGESLRDFDRRRPDQVRAGIMLVR